MHSDVFEVIWFKLEMMIDTTYPHVLIPVLVILALIYGQSGKKKQKFLHQICYKVLNTFELYIEIC